MIYPKLRFLKSIGFPFLASKWLVGSAFATSMLKSGFKFPGFLAELAMLFVHDFFSYVSHLKL